MRSYERKQKWLEQGKLQTQKETAEKVEKVIEYLRNAEIPIDLRKVREIFGDKK